MNNPYSVLGVSPNANEDEIKKAYRRLAKEYHPDKPGGNETKFKQINEAYDTIKNGGPQQQQNPFSGGGPFPGGNPFDNFEHVFSQTFGHRPPPPRNSDSRINIQLTVQELANRTSKSIDLKLRNGQIRNVTLTIPPGTTHKSEVRYAGYGETTVRGAPPGNLFVTYLVKPDRTWSVEEHNLVKRLNISIREAMLGTEKVIDMLDGRSLKLNIKPGTQSKTRLRIPEGGLSRSGRPNGDLYIEVNVKIPALTETDLQTKLEDLL
jgi:curved DNA-binding protein